MILKFPDLDTLKLVLINGAVPPAVSVAPASAGFDEHGQLWLEPSVTPARKAQDELKKYGVEIGKKSGAGLSAALSCWVEILPLLRDGEVFTLPEQTPVLFDLATGQDLARLATEILRLGNDRQGYRWLEERNGSSRALLRVITPPYYSLLRAIDAQGPQAPRAFIERGPRVWAQLGWTHPLAGRIKPPPGQLLLLRPPRQWTYLSEQPFRDIYEVLEFQLPGVKVGYREGDLGSRLPVTLRLARGGTDAAELWVLRDDPVAVLNDLVQRSDDQLLSRLAFAVGESKGRQTIVLRTRPSKHLPPVINNVPGFCPFLKLPNLFLPCGWGLHPPLRRDIVRKLLADDPNVLTWLYPEDKGAFTPETIAQDAFRPLTDWVDYLIDHEREKLQTWIQSATFDFETFVCDGDGPAKPKKPPDRGAARPGGKGGTLREVVDRGDEGKGDESLKALALDDGLSLVPAEPSAQQRRLRELEDEFILAEGNLDALARQAMWPELAQLNAALGHREDAAACWLHALWLNDDCPESWLWAWFRTEAAAVQARDEKGKPKPHSWAAASSQHAGPCEATAQDLDRVLTLTQPDGGDVRALAAYLVWASRRPAPPVDLVKRLNAVQRFLGTHEKLLSVRACWLAWAAFVELTHGDVLALARARDRVLEHLFNNGTHEQDLPGFLRFAGQPASQRFRGVREWMLALCKKACAWSQEAKAAMYSSSPDADSSTLGFIRLLFAYGLARLGERDASQALVQEARGILSGRGEPVSLLFQAYVFRITLALEGRKNAGPLPPTITDAVANLSNMDRYVIDRLRQHSSILEPQQQLEPYQQWVIGVDALAAKLREALLLPDGQATGQRLLAIAGEPGLQGKTAVFDRLRVFRCALEVAPRIGEEFAVQVLAEFLRTWDLLPHSPELEKLQPRIEALEPALFAAAHFDRKDTLQALVTRFLKVMRDHQEQLRLQHDIDKLFGQSLRGLRKLGMRDEVNRLLHSMVDLFVNSKELTSLAAITADGKPFLTMRALLHLASGWLYFGRDQQAEPMIVVARTLLFGADAERANVNERLKLARVYAQTAGGLKAERLKLHLEELFEKLPSIRDSLTTGRCYSLSHLDLVEAVVLAASGEESSLGGNVRRWLDDDEFLIRRRIHRDFHAAQGHT